MIVVQKCKNMRKYVYFCEFKCAKMCQNVQKCAESVHSHLSWKSVAVEFSNTWQRNQQTQTLTPCECRIMSSHTHEYAKRICNQPQAPDVKF